MTSMTVAIPLEHREAALTRGLSRYGRPAAIGLLVLVLCFLTVYPMAMLLYGSLHSTPPGMAGSSISTAIACLATADNLRALVNTAALSLVKTVLSLALAILLAWIVARTDTPGRGVLEILITLPFFIPPILTATAWAMLGNAAGRHHQPGLALDHRQRRARWSTSIPTAASSGT